MIESKLGNNIKDEIFEPSFISELHRKEEDVKKSASIQKYNDIKNEYLETVKKWITDPLSQLTKLVELTVFFVESASPIVAQIFGTIIKGNAKLNFALELIGLVINVVNEFINSDFLKNTINHFVTLFNERKHLTNKSDVNEPVKKKSKKSFFKTIKGSLR
jgi:hypothetical protein